MSMGDQHDLKDVWGVFGEYTARCSCGWNSELQMTRAEAEDAHVAHRLAEIPDDDPRS